MNGAMNNPAEVFWSQYSVAPKYAALAANIRVDVCVVGGGIAGLTAAYLLQREGKTVCVLEAGEIGTSQSNRSTGHVTCALDSRYEELERRHGADAANLAAKSHTAAMAKIEDIIREEKLECELQKIDGYLFSSSQEKSDILDRELAAARRAGISGVAIVQNSILPRFNQDRFFKIPGQMQMRPAPYVAGIARAISRDCGKIHTRTRVVKVETSFDERSATITCEAGFTVTARNVVLATNSAFDNRFSIDRKQTRFRSYVIGAAVPKGTLPRALFWDTSDPFHYLRLSSLSSEQDMLLVGGEDHAVTEARAESDAYSRLLAWTRERFSEAVETSYKWSGEVHEPFDGLAFLGRDPKGKKNLFIISGASGNGITHATIGAILIADQIFERPNAWEEIYNPARPES